MDLRTRRALADVDARQMYLRPTCEGLLLTAAMGLTLPLVRDEDGGLIDGEAYVDAMLDPLLADTSCG